MTDPLSDQAPQPEQHSVRIEKALELLRLSRESVENILTVHGENIPQSMRQQLKKVRDLNIATDELLNIYQVLYDDLLATMRPREDAYEKDTWRREAYRTAFVWIEGTVFMMKRLASEAATVFQVQLKEEELAIINERLARLDEQGRAKRQKLYPDTRSNVRFAFNVMAKCYGEPFQLDAGGQEWVDFKTALDVRNRLTHPKSPRFLEVTNDEMSILVRTIYWFSDQVGQILKICTEAINEAGKQFDQSNKAIVQELVSNVNGSLNRALQVDQVANLLEEMRAQIGDTGWDERIMQAKAELEALKHYFISQITTIQKE